MDAVHSFMEKNPSSINDFIQWWTENKNKKDYSVVIPKGIEAVEIMTIHKAKGLQFPVVVLPFMNINTTKHGSNGFWHDIDLEDIEELPVAYFKFVKDLGDTILADIYNEEKQKTLLDLLNIAYVAFTRPQDKLFILSNYPKDTKFNVVKNTIAFHLHNFLKHKNQWEDGLTTYTFGECLPLPKKSNEALMKASLSGEDFPEFDNYISSDWRNRIYIRPVSKSPTFDDEKLMALVRGKLMHKVMEKVFSYDDVTNVLEQLNINGEITSSEKEIMLQKIKQIINLPELSNFYKKGIKVLNEAAILDENGEFFRPDRVVLFDKKAVVIDYKTGTPIESYKKQILSYKSLLSNMGYKDVDAYLIYLDEVKVEKA